MGKFIAILLLAAMINLSCGSIDGNHAVGVTGGSAGEVVDMRFLGRWAYYSPYELTQYLTFRSDGTCNFTVYQIGPVSSVEGTWRAYSGQYRIDAEGFFPGSGSYRVDTGNLFLRSGDIVFHYVKLRE